MTHVQPVGCSFNAENPFDPLSHPCACTPKWGHNAGSYEFFKYAGVEQWRTATDPDPEPRKGLASDLPAALNLPHYYSRLGGNAPAPEPVVKPTYGYVPVDEKQGETLRQLNQSFTFLEALIDKYVPDGRRKALALTHLETAGMFACKAVAKD